MQHVSSHINSGCTVVRTRCRFVLLYLGPTILLGNHSPYRPVYDEGRNVTLFLIIMTNGSTQDLKTQWEIPNPPESKGRVSFKNHIVDGQTANSTIAIADIQPVDEGIYAVNISNGCTAKYYPLVFHVYIDGPCSRETPNPLLPQNKTVIAEARLHDPKTLHLTATYTGYPDPNAYDIRWYRDGKLCCADDHNTTFYTCTRSRQGNCSFVAHMWITNYTRHDTGNYVTRSHSVFSGEGGNSSTVTVSK